MNKCNQFSDLELIKKTLEDKEFFTCIVERYEKPLARFIKRISGSGKEEVEDLLQEIFIKVYVNLNDFDENLKFSSWIYRIAHNTAVSHWRKRKVRPEITDLDFEEHTKNLASEFDLGEKIDSKLLRQEIRKVMAKMNVRYREILILRFFEEKDYREISDILRKPIGTVATMINRAKKEFKKKMEEMTSDE